MTEEHPEEPAVTNPNQDFDDAPGCLPLVAGPLRLVIASVIVLWIVFVAFAAMSAGSLSATIPLANGATGLLVFSLAGVWKLTERWPKMGPALAFAAGVMAVVTAAVQLILQMPGHPLPAVLAPVGWVFTLGVVPLGALLAVMRLQRWTKRWLARLEAAAPTTPESSKGQKPR